MRTIHAALALLAERFGVSDLRPDAKGFAEIILADTLSLYLRIVDEHEIELSLRLPGFDDHPKPEVLAELLRWNATSDGARIALEPGRKTVVIGQRVDVRQGTDENLAGKVAGFVLTTLDWHQGGTASLLERVKRHSEPTSLPEFGAIRL
jgi:hypothetical protein